MEAYLTSGGAAEESIGDAAPSVPVTVCSEHPFPQAPYPCKPHTAWPQRQKK